MFFFQAEDGIRDLVRSRGLGDVYKRQKVAEYRGGKTGILGLFMGEVMKLSKGKADPKMTSKMLEHKLTIDN